MPQAAEMVEVKSADLSGLALDWAVDAVLTGKPLEVWQKDDGAEWIFVYDGVPFVGPHKYSSDWAKGGLVIGEHRITFSDNINSFAAGGFGKRTAFGPTHLVAAMRCVVISSTGDAVMVPAVLLK